MVEYFAAHRNFVHDFCTFLLYFQIFLGHKKITRLLAVNLLAKKCFTIWRNFKHTMIDARLSRQCARTGMQKESSIHMLIFKIAVCEVIKRNVFYWQWVLMRVTQQMFLPVIFLKPLAGTTSTRSIGCCALTSPLTSTQHDHCAISSKNRVVTLNAENDCDLLKKSLLGIRTKVRQFSRWQDIIYEDIQRIVLFFWK